MVSVRWARCLSLLLAAALGAAGVLTVQHFTASEESPPPAKQSVNDTRVQPKEPPSPEPKRVDELSVVLAEWERLLTAEEVRRPKPVETHRQRLERAAERRRKYKQSCVETLKKILRLAKRGDLAYIPVPLRAEISKAIDADDYYDLCRAFNAMIAVGIVAPENEMERERWRGNLDEPWRLLAPRTREAIERHKQVGGTVQVLARPPARP